ncbi:hypothetical protein LOD99_6451 [Oopsacas minuta]|uniref:Uncharacterized protein n=1 Tax=Oopsacas minuta TaxID=111878 RepID=A0AAV7JM70_9METZ|nr:hypothetical protein LOD99_6451 [Oopsacas minuta]
MNLQFLYPDVSSTSVDLDVTQTADLVDFMKSTQEHSFKEAGKNLVKSKEMMKKQYDKKVNPIANIINVSDDVLIENLKWEITKLWKNSNLPQTKHITLESPIISDIEFTDEEIQTEWINLVSYHHLNTVVEIEQIQMLDDLNKQ